MTWQRFAQLSAETQSLADVDGLTGATGAVISTTQKYTGDYSYRFSGTSRPLGVTGIAHTAARTAMFFRHNGIAGNDFAPFIGMMVDGCPVVWGLNLTTGEIALRAGWVQNTFTVRFPVTVTTAAIGAINQWYAIGMTANLASANGFVTLYVDGQPITSWTGDTRVYRSTEGAARTTIAGCYAVGTPTNWMSGASTWLGYTYTDDLYVDVWDGAGLLADAPPPSRRFLAIFPNGAGSVTQWTPSAGANWQNVDDAPPNNETDYNKALAPSLLDLYTFADVTLPADHAIRAVIPTAYARKSDAGVNSQAKLAAKAGGATVTGTAQNLPLSYNYIWERWETQPGGATPWNETAINNAEFGVESAGTF
jgi:hypothetical protein